MYTRVQRAVPTHAFGDLYFDVYNIVSILLLTFDSLIRTLYSTFKVVPKRADIDVSQLSSLLLHTTIDSSRSLQAAL